MNICVVGYGAVGQVHTELINTVECTNLYAICDVDKNKADAGAEKYSCIAYYNFDNCIFDDNIESIHICTPHYLHFDMIKKAVGAGKTVVVEKPVVMKKEELKELYSKYSDEKIIPVFQNRRNLCVQVLKQYIESDHTIGKLVASKGFLTWHRDAQYYQKDGWRGKKAFEGGGVLINQAIHILDLMIYLGGNIKNVSASMSNKSLKDIIEVEDTVDAYFEYENGAKGLFYVTNAYPIDSEFFLEFVFERSVFRYCDKKLYKDGELICEDDSKKFAKSYWGSGHERVFYDLYVKKTSDNLENIKNTMYAMFAIYESAEKNSLKTEVNVF